MFWPKTDKSGIKCVIEVHLVVATSSVAPDSRLYCDQSVTQQKDITFWCSSIQIQVCFCVHPCVCAPMCVWVCEYACVCACMREQMPWFGLLLVRPRV